MLILIQLPNIIRMFALNTPSSCISKTDNGYFFIPNGKLYQKDTRLLNPYGYPYLLCVFELGGSGGNSLSFIVNFVRKMPSSSKICDMENNSIHTATSAHETRKKNLSTLISRSISRYRNFVKSKILRMFVASIVIKHLNAGQRLAFCLRAFFMPVIFEYLRYRYLCTPVQNYNGTAAFGCNAIDSGKDTGIFCFIMGKTTSISNAVLSNSIGASAHETRKKNRHRSETKAARQEIISYFYRCYPEIRTMKIKDSGRIFIARARAGKYMIHTGACSIERLKIKLEHLCSAKLLKNTHQ